MTQKAALLPFTRRTCTTLISFACVPHNVTGLSRYRTRIQPTLPKHANEKNPGQLDMYLIQLKQNCNRPGTHRCARSDTGCLDICCCSPINFGIDDLGDIQLNCTARMINTHSLVYNLFASRSLILQQPSWMRLHGIQCGRCPAHDDDTFANQDNLAISLVTKRHITRYMCQ